MITANITGHLGGDPELRYSASGAPFLRLSIASNSRVRSPEGEWQDSTEWVRVTVLGARAEALADKLTKGQKVFVTGRLEARPWTDNAGNVRAGLDLTAHEIDFLSQRQEEQPRPDQQRVAGYPARGPAAPQAQNRAATRRQPAGAMPADDLYDLPF